MTNSIRLLLVLLLAAFASSAEVTQGVDRVLQESDGAAVPLVGKADREAAARSLDEALELKKQVRDQAWVVWSLDSLRRSGSADSAAWYELYDSALLKLQDAMTLTGDRYPAEMSPAELGALKENLRQQAAEGYLQSLDLLEGALEANPWDDSVLGAIAGVLDDLARLYTSLDLRDRAIEMSRKRLAIDASNYSAHWDLAEMLSESGRKKEALNRYEKACRALRAFAWEDAGGSRERPVGQRRDHLAMLLRARITTSMALQDEDGFRSAINEWEVLATPAEQKEIAELRSWLRRGGGELGQALKIERAWKLLEQGRSIEARELLVTAVAEGTDPAARTRNVMALAELEFYRLDMKQVALDRLQQLPDGLSAELEEEAGTLRSGMLLDLGISLEEDDPARAWEMYQEAALSPGDQAVELYLRLGALLLNRPQQGLDWLLKAERACSAGKSFTNDQLKEILRLQTIAYRRLDKPEEARRSMRRAEELKP